MATIRKRYSKWEAQIRRLGFTAQTRTFTSKADAEAWARDRERAMDRGEVRHFSAAANETTVGDLLTRYEQEITPKKKGAHAERYRIGTIARHPIAKLTVGKVRPAHIASYRDERAKSVKGASVRRELAILQHCFEVAGREWGIGPEPNPVRQVQLPPPGKARQRRLTSTDTHNLKVALACGSPWYLSPLITLAIETAMRRGEILAIRWENVNLELRVIHIPDSKNGESRDVPLSPVAHALLSPLPRISERVIPVSANAARLAWERLKKRALLPDLRFHDLRHEGVSRLFEKGLSVPEVAAVSGHRDPRMLLRYTHPRAEDIAGKLAMTQIHAGPSPT